jgi:hypothetical protein
MYNDVPVALREAIRRESRPDQQLFLEYQRELMEDSIELLEGKVMMLLTVLEVAGRPYVYIGGDGYDCAQQQWLMERLPQASANSWPGSGHFPHLVHCRRFAELLAATGKWSADEAPAQSRR